MMSVESVSSIEHNLHTIASNDVSLANNEKLDAISLKISKIIAKLAADYAGPEEAEEEKHLCCFTCNNWCFTWINWCFGCLKKNSQTITVILLGGLFLLVCVIMMVVSFAAALSKEPGTNNQAPWGTWTVFAGSTLGAFLSTSISIGLLVKDCFDKRAAKKNEDMRNNTASLILEATKLLALVLEMKTLSIKTDIHEKEETLSNCVTHYEKLSYPTKYAMTQKKFQKNIVQANFKEGDRLHDLISGKNKRLSLFQKFANFTKFFNSLTE